MDEKPQICSPYARRVPRSVSDQVAVEERVDNVRIGAACFHGASAAVERMRLWDNGRVLRVRFLDGDPVVQSRVEAIAMEWEQVANLSLTFGRDRDAEIRVSFAEEGFSWSAVGTDALTTDARQATMNFGWLYENTGMREYQRVVRHEFGHALGMIHEHQSPAAGGVIPWDRPKVYAYYAGQGWSPEDVDHNIFELYSEDSTNHTTYDPASIMQYAIPDSLTIGSFAIAGNTELSPMDRQFMGRQYPRGGPGLRELVVNGDAIKADLALSGEVDTYHFTVTEPGTYVMETTGPSDTVLLLHGPSDRGAVLAFDRDRGLGRNERIVRTLLPGEYWLSVRHSDPDAIGTYAVSLQTR
ncbi:hypothetical protein Acy02nite_31530 [Actinoplanes cyaneus]|uniref:Peptidase metallopeptidase domain-containing protein n=1 Tax=Actinoplanes cyaneus TaxID=52696 RepID=A0A919M467_9ACTN|nr:M12 family metallopeptidase [Actinoplanes cyaneus]MCW2142464.1 hypothetical protein [Actinoplanes cyaneus]GID65272.1 hypothetical protein Acy02nite_31530 [Actinoplanes cyaneus]